MYTYERYETGRKGSELKTSLSRNLLSRSHDIGYEGSSPGELEAEARRGGRWAWFVGNEGRHTTSATGWATSRQGDAKQERYLEAAGRTSSGLGI